MFLTVLAIHIKTEIQLSLLTLTTNKQLQIYASIFFLVFEVLNSLNEEENLYVLLFLIFYWVVERIVGLGNYNKIKI